MNLNKDVLYELLLKADADHLPTLCYLNKTTQQICQSKQFWNNKVNYAFFLNDGDLKTKLQANDKPQTLPERFSLAGINDKRQTINFYLCGPLPFMRMAEFTLRQIGFAPDQIRKEHFVIDKPPTAPLLTDTKHKKITIHYQLQTYHIEVVYPTSILDAALQKGIQLPYSCKGGRCSTCAGYCLNGKVVMSMNEVLTDKDIAKGLVLTCVGFAATDLELSFES